MKLIRGAQLTADQIAQVKAAFIYRNTVEHPCPMSGGSGMQTDADYIAAHAFYFRADGCLAECPPYCEPAYLAD